MNLTALVKEFFVDNEFNYISDKVAVLRNDGTVLFSNSINSTEAANIGALASGIWQASQSLSTLVSRDESSDGAYRLSFDTTSEGIYILPVGLAENTCYFCCIFKEQINPGKLKQKIRNIAFLLETFIREEEMRFAQTRSESSIKSKNSLEESRAGHKFLFENITDQEMDQLFGLAGI